MQRAPRPLGLASSTPAAAAPSIDTVSDNVVTLPAGTSKRSLAPIVMLIAAAFALAFGYATRHSDAIVPYEGLGYYIGIAGGTGLLLQLAYSALKRLKLFRRMSASKALFNCHMFLGLAAPIAILYHCRFSWGAFNSNVALVAMMLVVVSGLTGRFIYRRVHAGLNDKRSDAHALLEHARQLMGLIDVDAGGSSGEIAAYLADFASSQALHESSLSGQFRAAATIRLKKANAQLEFSELIRHAIAKNALKLGWSESNIRQRQEAANTHAQDFLDTTVRAAKLAFLERLLAHWHMVHVPFYGLLLVSGIAHVVAVHWY